jgi:hypothetical protein
MKPPLAITAVLSTLGAASSSLNVAMTPPSPAFSVQSTVSADPANSPGCAEPS